MVKNRIALAVVLVASFAKVSAGMLDHAKNFGHNQYVQAGTAAWAISSARQAKAGVNPFFAFGKDAAGYNSVRFGTAEAGIKVGEGIVGSVVDTQVQAGLGKSSVNVNTGDALVVAGTLFLLTKFLPNRQ